MRTSYHNKGFTLVEMVVAIGIFTVVAVVAVGALLKTIDANKKSQSIKTAVTNLNFALDSMTRELRVGTRYTCGSGAFNISTLNAVGTGCNTGSNNWYIAFYSSRRSISNGTPCNLIYVYNFDGSTLSKAQQTACDTQLTSSSLYPLITSSFNASNQQDVAIKFAAGTIKVVSGTAAQPYVQLRFRGSAGASEKVKSTFDIQTTISQRLRE